MRSALPLDSSKNPEPNIIMDINKIQSALRSLKEERAHIEEYLQNAAVRKKELDKELNVFSMK